MHTDNTDALQLGTIPETGALPESRLKDAKTGREIYTTLREGDSENAKTRAKVQAMFDGSPPYDPAQLRKSKQSYRCNLNFGEAESLLDYAMSGYVDLLHSVEDLVHTPTLWGEDAEKMHYTSLLSREISRTIREWPQFTFNFLHLCTEFVGHGLGIGHFEDRFDWRWRAAGQKDFLIPRGTLASEDEMEIAMARREYPIYEIWAKIKDEQSATEAGWNVAETRAALSKAHSNSPKSSPLNFEDMEIELKNNDWYTQARATTITLIHAWVREFDGTVTHNIFTEEDGCKEFLYSGKGFLGSMQQGFVMFTYGLGTNAHYHGVRGLGYKIFPAIQVSNRLRSQLVDGSMLASSVMLQSSSETDFSNMALNYYGAYAVIAPGMTVVPQSTPNFQNSVMPVLSDMGVQLQQRTGQYTTQSVFGGGSERRTRFEVAAHLEQAAKLSVTSLNLFYQPWDRLLREIVRRMIRPDYVSSEPGGDAIEFLKYRLQVAGVPIEAFHNIDLGNVRAIRAVGSGSPAARSSSLRNLMEVVGSYDPVGKHNLLRDVTVTEVGVTQADRYIPRDPGTRLPVDAKIAILENDALVEGKQIEVMPEEAHLVHIEKHLAALGSFLEEEQQGVAIEELVPRMMSLYEHAVAHLEYVQGDVTMQEQVAMYRQSLQQAGEIIHNGMKRLAKLQRDQAEAGPAPEDGMQQAPQEPSKHMIAMQERLEQHQQSLQQMDEKFQLKQNLAIQEAALKRSLKDADKASDLLSQLR
jgi:hypothetical protein